MIFYEGARLKYNADVNILGLGVPDVQKEKRIISNGGGNKIKV